MKYNECMVGFCYFIQKTPKVFSWCILLQSVFFSFFCLCRYLNLVEGAEMYAVVRDSTEAVVSLPPVTNSERSKVRLYKKQSFKNTNKTHWGRQYIILFFVFKCFQSMISIIPIHDRSQQRSFMCSWKSHHQLIWLPASLLWANWYAKYLKLDCSLKLKGKLQQVLRHVLHLRES